MWSKITWIFHYNNASWHSSMIGTDFLTKFFVVFRNRIIRLGNSPWVDWSHKSNSGISAFNSQHHKRMENWIKLWHACIDTKRTHFEGGNKDLYLITWFFFALKFYQLVYSVLYFQIQHNLLRLLFNFSTTLNVRTYIEMCRWVFLPINKSYTQLFVIPYNLFDFNWFSFTNVHMFKYINNIIKIRWDLIIFWLKCA